MSGWRWVNGPLAQVPDGSTSQQPHQPKEQQQPGAPGFTDLIQGVVELAQSLLPLGKDSQDSSSSSSGGSSSTSLTTATPLADARTTTTSSSLKGDEPAFQGASGPLVAVPLSALDMAARMLRLNVRPGVGVCAEACNIVGVANLDAFGDLVCVCTQGPGEGSGLCLSDLLATVLGLRSGVCWFAVCMRRADVVHLQAITHLLPGCTYHTGHRA